MPSRQMPRDVGGFSPVSTLMLFPGASGRFKVYIRQAGNFVLYASENETFTRGHLLRLKENGVEEVYILQADRDRFARYVRLNLAAYLGNDRVPVELRARAFTLAARDMIGDIYESKLPVKLVKRAQFARVREFVEKTLGFLSGPGALKCLAGLMSHDYRIFDHSLEVFVLQTALLSSYGLDEQEMARAGMGAMLHDLGLKSIDRAILDKPGPLTHEERQLVNTHPAKGVALCSELNLSQTSLQCILFHHERADGSGYPAGAGAGEIPVPALATGLVDVYAALTANRPYAQTLSPFEALRVMREMKDAFDLDMYKRFVMVLSGAEIV